jgi:hypothetical protein
MCRFGEEPGAEVGLVDPVFEQAGGRHIADLGAEAVTAGSGSTAT